MRPAGRSANQVRPVTLTRNYTKHAEGSVLVEFGDTKVLCTASIDEGVPRFLKGQGQGWITAEYGMLPRATHSRGRREAVSGIGGRTHEIQRLIGRSLRMMVDLRQLGQHTLRVDCDVLNADGGTRCASITGAALALREAIRAMVAEQRLVTMPELLPVAAVSAGIVAGMPLLDLDYNEDSRAEVDANFVMAGDGCWIEVQSTAEGAPFAPEQFTVLAALATTGLKQIFTRLW